MRNLLLVLLTGVLLMLGSCFYNETGVYVVDPVPGDPPVFSVTTNLDTLTEIEINDSLEVHYEAMIDNGEFYLMEAYVANEGLYYSDSIRNSFWLQHDDVPFPGTDTLLLVFYYSTNSHSLADIINLEANIVRKKYGILFNRGDTP
jgi:hypothetical protein